MGRKKLLYILHNVQIGGVEVALLSAIPDLNKKYDLRVLALGTVDHQIISNLTENEKSVFYSFDFKPYLYPFRISKLLSFIADFNPDLMICSLWRASLLGTIAKQFHKKICFVSFIHSSGFAHALDRFFSVLAINKADKILTDSEATSKFVTSNFLPEAPVHVISFCTNPSPDQNLIAPLNTDQIRFLFLGRLNKVKNLTLTVDAIADLRSRNMNVTLDIYGKDDGERNGLEKQIEALALGDFVHFKGEIYASEKLKIFKQYNFLIQLSSREGMAMSVAEAMQNGLVCIVTPVGEIQNYATDMETAIFIDVSNKEKWEQSLDKVETVIHADGIYEQISSACYEKFKHVKTYSDSLIDELETL
jgi:glycosyltransferase involved in cell wall biosynthesis